MAYTPFFAQAGQNFGEAIKRRDVNDLAGKAYMGDPKAMQELMSVSPDIGARIMERNQERKKQQQQEELQKQTRQRKLFMENKEIIDSVVQDIAGFDNFEEAQQYFERKKEESRPIFGDAFDDVQLTEQMWQDSKRVGNEGDPVQRSVEVPGEGTKLVRKSGKIEFKPASLEGRQAYIRSQEQAIEQATDKAGKVEAVKLQAKAKQSLKNEINTAAFAAREQLPRINNLEKLSAIAETGTLARKQMEMKRAFGVDVSTEEEFMAESNRVILDAASALKGALSDRENEYLEAVGPGIGKSQEGNLKIIRNLKIITENAIARQNALKNFDGDPVDFNFQGKSFDSTIKTEAVEGEIYINPSTGEKGQVVDGKWQTL